MAKKKKKKQPFSKFLSQSLYSSMKKVISLSLCFLFWLLLAPDHLALICFVWDLIKFKFRTWYYFDCIYLQTINFCDNKELNQTIFKFFWQIE